MKRRLIADSHIGGEVMSNGVMDTAARRKKKRKAGSADFLLTALVLGLVIFGVIMVFSASYYTALNKEGTPYYYLIRDAIYAALGTVVMAILAVTDYRIVKNISYFTYGACVVLLIVVLFAGTSINNAARWIYIGPISIMPGELAKMGCIFAIAKFLSEPQHNARSMKHGVLPSLLMMGIPLLLIIIQPSTTTAMTLAVICIGMMYVDGMSMKIFAALGGVGALGLGVYIIKDGGYKLQRIVSFLNPFADSQGSGYQVVQSLLALGSGGITGVGLGKSIQKTLYLPDPQNDFIIAIIGEELGLVGLIVLLLVYLLLIWRCVRIVIKAPDKYSTLVSAGITIMLASQVAMNVMIATSMMPPTGVALPFVSWGANSLLIFMASMGIMLNISSKIDEGELRKGKKKKRLFRKNSR